MLPVRRETLLRHAAALCCRIAGSGDGLLWRHSELPTRDIKRGHRAMPTHGIGRYRHLVPVAEQESKRKVKARKEIKQDTDYEYGTLNFQASGHNMVYVDNFARYMHNFFNQMSVTVEESYAKPTKTKEVLLLQDVGNRMIVDSVLTTHERVVQVSGLRATLAPIILEVFMMNQPEGVQLLVKQHTDDDYMERFKARPDLEKMKATVT